MYYYGARYYDPRISIFISVDPLAEQTMDPYLYTGNNSVMFTHPTGMSKEGGGEPKGNPGYLLTPVYRSVTPGVFTFKAVTHYKSKPATAHMLQLVSGLHINAINNTKVINIMSGQDWHDGSFTAKEKKADIVEQEFADFNSFVDKYYGDKKLKKLYENPNNSEETKINRVNTWWKKYKEENPKKDDL